MATVFKSMNELTEYLEQIEARIKTLEQENERLRAIQPARESADGNAIAKYVSRYIPQTDLLSPSFFKRAFAVWGHFFVANFLISLVFLVLYLCLMMAVFGFSFGNLIQTQ